MSLVLQSNAENRALSPSPPPRSFEVFAHKIPVSVPEQELISMFEKYGEIYKLRLFSQGSGSNNYAFVRFMAKSSVREAILRWNGYEIRKGYRIYVCRSVDNKNLVLCNVPRSLSSYEIYYRIGMCTTGLMGVDVHPPRVGRGENSGLALLRYQTHTSASIAKKLLSSVRKRLWKYPVHVEWHTPGLLTDELAPSAFGGMGTVGVVPLKETRLTELYSERRAETCSNFWATSSYHDLASKTVFYTEISNMRYADEVYWGCGETWCHMSTKSSCNS